MPYPPRLAQTILQQVLKDRSTPLSSEQILNEVHEIGYPRVKAREVDDFLQFASSDGSVHQLQIPQRDGLGWALTDAYKRKLGIALPAPAQPQRVAPPPTETPKALPTAPGQVALPAFGNIEPARLVALDDSFAVVADKCPVSPGHTLIIARRPVARFQDLTAIEKARLLAWIDWTQQHLASLSPAPNAFNLGLDDGAAAGQTIAQFHFHVIPRYAGDVPNVRGGIRQIIVSS